ncbi:lytic transglycosylase domain-containing protein [Mesorhizobium humile]|uniref:Lytic transglycosylase domain-containing protein n=1 Tax=Mesorhizobium humile TaxID=3072313 RepID=A0ABU4YLW7_9HYPH|nr:MULTISPECIES: lytic transglycosylase domain-containing protein [unclassified Mesorhizobium]MDX8457872.1 lytic transglycosylase domain-containing protein [Mesorhizobium sp. VK2D]MDX8487952.1 lytic transglycosylase domain-containing protein [Mesorhizobium sp. VK2B]
MPVKPFDPIAGQAAVARSGGQGRPGTCPSMGALFALPRMGPRSGRRSLALDGSEHGGRLSACRDGGARVIVQQCIAMLSACAFIILGSAVDAAELSPRAVLKPCIRTAIETRGDWSAYVCEAAKRFDLPERLIRAVMDIESVGDVHAFSPKGAMGLMQIMPATWRELRIKHGLGNDPFDPRDNIMAGAAYLREMLDRFGPKGFIAAYNAGPQRYEEHLSTGRSLPRETIDYAAKLMPLIKGAIEIAPRSQGLGTRSSADRSQLFERGARATNDAVSRGSGGVERVGQTVFTEIRSADAPSKIDSAVNDLTALEPPPHTASEDVRPTMRRAANNLFIPRSAGAAR